MAKINPQQNVTSKGFQVTLRTASTSDGPALNELAKDVFKTSEFLVTTPEEFSSFSDDQQSERIEKFEEDPDAILLVVECNNELIGMLDFQNGKRRRIAHRGSMGMSVRSTWRNKGVGQILIQALINWVESHPLIEVISLGVIEGNKAGMALYQKMGFEITGREPFFLKLADGSFMADVSMSLKVKKIKN